MASLRQYANSEKELDYTVYDTSIPDYYMVSYDIVKYQATCDKCKKEIEYVTYVDEIYGVKFKSIIFN